jgi:phenylacetic acid degradation operon negative regulatory protein
MDQTVEQEDIELVMRPARSTQFYLFTLFGDYIVPRGGQVWTNDLLRLLDLLDVSEGTARTTLSRMRQQGWFDTEKDGRESRYVITPRGRAILEEGDRRIFEDALTDWDGCWRMVVYSLPEGQRRDRNALRKKLLWYGFGNLAPGTWVTPHDRQAEVAAVVADMALTPWVTQFTAETADNRDVVATCWPLDELAADYAGFLARYGPDYDAYRRGALSLSPAECFVRRFWLTFNFQRFPLKDPNLPVELLPHDWPGTVAREMFRHYRDLLGEGMGDFMDRIVDHDDERGDDNEG